MATYTAVTTKTLRARSSYRTDLAIQLRDTTNTIWDTTTLNMCLDEALALVQVQYPPVRVFEYTPVATNLQQQLPADCVRVLDVSSASETSGQQGTAPLHTPVGFTVRRQYPLVAGSGTEDLSILVLVLDEAPDTSRQHYVRYVAAAQVWGSWATIGSGVDSATTKDLNPCSIGDGVPLLLFWACARCAALEWATQLIPSDGGRDFETEYDRAQKKRDALLMRSIRPRQARVVSSLFG